MRRAALRACRALRGRRLLAAAARAGCGRRGRRRRGGGTARSWRRSTRCSSSPSRSAATTSAVTNLTKPGAEPHDLELTPAGRRRRSQGATSWSTRRASSRPSTRPSTRRRRTAPSTSPPPRTSTCRHARSSPASSTPTADRRTDPHFWLDPARYAAVAAGHRRPARRRPTRPTAADYAANADGLRREARRARPRVPHGPGALRQHRDRHQPRRVRLPRPALRPRRQVGITGLSPDAEPQPRHARRASPTSSRRTASPRSTPRRWSARRFADTVAGRPGATVATLDPIEGLTDASAGHDYFEVMRSNLAALRAGQGCS